MTPTDRAERRRQRTHAKLIAAAEQVFGQKGYQDATVLDITDAADVSKRTFYLHFDDKENIIEAIALKSLTELRTRVEDKEHERHETEPMPQRDGFRMIATEIFQYVYDNRDLMQIIFGDNGSFRLRQMTQEFTTQAWYENFQRECEWNPDAVVPMDILCHAISGVLHQAMAYAFKYPDKYTPSQLADMCASILYDSIEINMKFFAHPTAEELASIEETD